MIKILIPALLLIFFSCKSQQNHNTLHAISEKIGDNAIIDFNLDRTFALVQEKFALVQMGDDSSVQQGDYTSRFLIVRISDNTVIREGKVVNGYIKWINDDIIEIFEMPGVLKEGQSEDDFKVKIDVRNFKGETQKP